VDEALVASAVLLVRAIGALLNAVATLMRRNAFLVGLAVDRWRFALVTLGLIATIVRTVLEGIASTRLRIAVLFPIGAALLVRSANTIDVRVTDLATVNAVAVVGALESHLWIALLAVLAALRIKAGTSILPMIEDAVAALDARMERRDVGRVWTASRALLLVETVRALSNSIANRLLLDADVRRVAELAEGSRSARAADTVAIHFVDRAQTVSNAIAGLPNRDARLSLVAEFRSVIAGRAADLVVTRGAMFVAVAAEVVRNAAVGIVATVLAWFARRTFAVQAFIASIGTLSNAVTERQAAQTGLLLASRSKCTGERGLAVFAIDLVTAIRAIWNGITALMFADDYARIAGARKSITIAACDVRRHERAR